MNTFSNKVLIVDTDPTVCETLAQTLKGAGYAPEVHLHPRSVVNAIVGHDFSLAFIDLNLPYINGADLGSIVKKNGHLNELILMGGNGSLEDTPQASCLGAYGLLQKPLDSHELHTLLTRLRERSRLHRYIQNTQQRHHTLIQNIPLLIFSLNRQFDLAFINQASHTLLGFPPEEAINTQGWFIERIHPLERERIRRALETSFTQGTPLSLQCRMLQRNGAELHGILRTMPHIRETDEINPPSIEEIEGIFVDITDRVFLEKALVQNEKLKTLGAISSEMAHEVRNPLMSIAGFARRLEKKAPDMPEVGIILRESLRLERLLNRIRDYLNPVEARPKECAINSVLGDCLGLLFSEMNKRGIWCKFEKLADRPIVLADPDYLSQICITLMRNAIMLLESDNYFTISSHESNEAIHIEFHIPSADDAGLNTEHLFMPFDEGGQSYGLPLCYRLVKDMGGLLAFNREGGTSIFTLSLPKIKQDFEQQPSDTPQQHKSSATCFDAETDTLAPHHFNDIFRRAYHTASCENCFISLLAIEMDGFDAFVRKHGDAKAEARVQTLAKTYAAMLHRPGYLLSRHGSHVFLALLLQTGPDEALGIAKQLRAAAADPEIPTAQNPTPAVTVSIGLMSFVPNADNPAQGVLDSARHSLSLAKRKGSNAIYALDQADFPAL